MLYVVSKLDFISSTYIKCQSIDRVVNTHSQIRHYFFSYLPTCEVYLIEVLEIMAQMLQYIIFFKPESNKGEFRLYFELFEKVVGCATK